MSTSLHNRNTWFWSQAHQCHLARSLPLPGLKFPTCTGGGWGCLLALTVVNHMLLMAKILQKKEVTLVWVNVGGLL